MDPTAGHLEVGRVHKAHGLKGEVSVSLLTDRTERLASGAHLWADGVERVVSSATRHQDRWIVRFEGVDGREAAEGLRGATLSAPPLDDADVLWVHQLIGARVVLGDGTEIGTVTSVLANPAHDILVLDDGALVPIVFVSDTDGLPERVEIDPPEGLLDLGREA